MSYVIEEAKWNSLIERIRAGKCTPFLGAGVNDPKIIPQGSFMAQEWARDHSFPLEDKKDLAQVAQFLALNQIDPMECKDEMIRRWFGNLKTPDFNAPDEPLGILAKLPLPIYMTTNYDSLMMAALKSQGKGKDPHREFCKWNEHPHVKNSPSLWKENRGFKPTIQQPVVYHLHGIDEISASMVLTEDDYVDFLVKITKDRDLLPPFVQEVLAATSLIFIGYRMADWTFRVLFRGLLSSIESGLRRVNVAVQLTPEDSPEPERVQEYLNSYYGNMSTLVYWGTAKQFAVELRQRCERAGVI